MMYLLFYDALFIPLLSFSLKEVQLILWAQSEVKVLIQQFYFANSLSVCLSVSDTKNIDPFFGFWWNIVDRWFVNFYRSFKLVWKNLPKGGYSLRLLVNTIHRRNIRLQWHKTTQHEIELLIYKIIL